MLLLCTLYLYIILYIIHFQVFMYSLATKKKSLYVRYSIVLRKYQFGLPSFTISIDLIHKVLAFRCLLTIDIGFFLGKNKEELLILIGIASPLKKIFFGSLIIVTRQQIKNSGKKKVI